MRTARIALLALAALLLAGATALAAGLLPWQNHAAPYNLLFGNHIDTHQQSRLVDGRLQGYLYIEYTGALVNGVPEAVHGDCTAPAANCVVGWTLRGVPVEATLVAMGEGSHPTFCIERKDRPRQQGYSHFHWLGAPDDDMGLVMGAKYEGYLLQLRAVDTFYFQHHGGFLVTPGIDNYTHNNVVVCD